MKEIITVNVGDAGLAIGDQVLSLYLTEHSLRNYQNQRQQGAKLHQFSNHLFFDQLQSGCQKYRGIGLNSDRISTDCLLQGQNQPFYNPSKFLNTKSQSGGFYSRGYSLMRELKQDFEDTLRKTAENCSHVQGILFNGSLSGGAGGLLSQACQLTALGYPKVAKIGSLLYPSQSYCSNIVQPYNFTLSANLQLNHLDLVIPFDNQALYKACEQHLENQSPGFAEINRLIAHFQSTLTLSMRQPGALTTNFSDLMTNLICYPRIHFAYPSFVGFPGDSRNLIANNTYKLANSLLDPSARLFEVMAIMNKIAVSTFYRNANALEIQQCLLKIRQEKHFNCVFEEWSPLGFRIAANEAPITQLPYQSRVGSRFASPSCCSLTSSMQFYRYFGHQNQKFDRLYAKRAFVHWYMGWIQEGELTEAREDLAALEKDYEPCSCCIEHEEEEQEVQ